MLAKIAIRNIHRSIRDYAIYFVTLTIGVAIFYAFNSIGSQEVMFDIQNTAEQRQFEMTQGMLNLFSGLIACVMGFLVLYANRFLIRRRKKEFGTYLLLGMSAVSVSAIVLMETVVVGIGALIVGLLLGIVISQALSIFTATLFGTVIVDYVFTFSEEGFFSTLGCFALIFVIVALFNTFSVNRYRLIDLLSADKKNERGGVRNPWLCFAVFLIALGVLIYAYQQLIESGMVMLDDPRFARATIAMLVGSFLFFWSLAGFVIAVITRMRGVYLRGLNVFTVRQIASKINTAFVSLWVVCVMLFFSITTFSCGMGLVEVFTANIDEANPYSTTLQAQIWNMTEDGTSLDGADVRAKEMQAEAPQRFASAESYGWDMAAALESNASELWSQTVENAAQIDLYAVPGCLYGTLVDAVKEKGSSFELTDTLSAIVDNNLMVVPVSQLNGLRTMNGEEPVQLADNQALIMNNMEMAAPMADAIADAGLEVDILGHGLQILPDIDATQIDNNAMLSTAMYIAVPDYIVGELRSIGVIPEVSYLNVNYREEGEASDVRMQEIIAATQPKELGGFERGFAGADDIYASLLWPVTATYSRIDMIAQASGLRMMITYLALYIGFVFLMATATIIAIQQLSEASDSVPRYRLLNKLGCDRRMTNKSLFKQVLVYFLTPLVLAVCHSVCAIGVLSGTLFDAVGSSIFEPSMLAGILVLVIYGGYMLITYFVSRSIVK